MYVTAYVVTVVNLGGVSPGGYLYIFWLYRNPTDFLYSQMKIMAMGTVITFVAATTASPVEAGSVGVGRNTRSR